MALALPLTIAAGCSGFHQSNIIDYTVSEAEYLAATSPPETSAEPELLAALPNTATPESVAHQETMAAKEPMAVAKLPQLPQPSALPTLPPAPNNNLSVAAAEAATHAPGTAYEMPQQAAAEPELATAFDKKAWIENLKFTPSIYTTVGLGVSRINADTSAAPGWTADEIIDGAGQAGIGVDIFKRLSVEAHTADYGSAGLSPEGRVNYHMNGISALIYAGPNLNRFRRRGFNGYARVGFNQLENTPVGNVPFLSQTSQHGSFGLGAEYNTRFGLGVRADVVAYDGDVQFGQLGMLYRLGYKPRTPKLAAAVAPDALPMLPTLPAPSTPPPAQPPYLPPAPAVPQLGAAKPGHSYATPAPQPSQVMPQENTQDIVFQKMTDTQTTGTDACTALNGTLNNVNFQRGSAHLTHSSTFVLDRIASTLSTCQHRNIVVSAHTDNDGAASDNIFLSKQRARQVSMFLASRGVSMQRIRAVAYGESQPVASNGTRDGRSRNRRVELTVQ